MLLRPSFSATYPLEMFPPKPARDLRELNAKWRDHVLLLGLLPPISFFVLQRERESGGVHSRIVRIQGERSCLHTHEKKAIHTQARSGKGEGEGPRFPPHQSGAGGLCKVKDAPTLVGLCKGNVSVPWMYN